MIISKTTELLEPSKQQQNGNNKEKKSSKQRMKTVEQKENLSKKTVRSRPKACELL